MKHWQETASILADLEQLVAQGRTAALATVVRIRGSAYRRPGAKMLIADDGTLGGSVSGGCLEADVREVGLAVMSTGVPQLLHYDTGTDDLTPWGLGLGCNGSVDIFVQAAHSPENEQVRVLVADLLRGDASFTVSTIVAAGPAPLGRMLVINSDGRLAGSADDARLDLAIATRAQAILGEGVYGLHDVEGVRVFTEVQVPPPHLLICGAGEDARPLAQCAQGAGFRVIVADHRPAYLAAEWYPAGTRLIVARPGDLSSASGQHIVHTPSGDLPIGPATYAVVKTHSLAHDREWVERLLLTDVPYIGVLGPRARVGDLLQQLGADGNDRVYGPVGLDLGADGPQQIALSIVAEVLAVWSRREPRHLRDREGVIHAS